MSLALGLEAGGWGALVERSSSGSLSPLLPHGPGGFAAGLASLARRCGVCLATFPSAWLLERHALLQHAGQPNDDKPFTCEQCGQRYRYRSAYVKHREQNHRARLPADKLFTCDVCGMQFRYLKSFKKHRLNHALERLQRVPEHHRGSISSITSTAAAERSDQVSSTGEPVQHETGSDVASSMDNRDEPRDNLDSNRDSVSAKEEASSETASVQEQDPADTASIATAITARGRGIEVDASDENNVHQTSQDDDRDRLESTTERVIAEIVRNHDSDRRERRFACPFCGKCVRSKENLKLHVRKHTGERPFVCLFCGRAFGGKSDLTRHLRIHTGERPYHCEMCGKCFARADYLSKHLTTHIHQR